VVRFIVVSLPGPEARGSSAALDLVPCRARAGVGFRARGARARRERKRPGSFLPGLRSGVVLRLRRWL